MPSIKSAARALVEALPENATWEDLMRAIYVRQTIEAGLADSEADRGQIGGSGAANFRPPSIKVLNSIESLTQSRLKLRGRTDDDRTS
jgi:hypothetical protein